MLYMFRVVSPSIIRSTYNCIYSIWHLSNRYCYLPLSWKSWNYKQFQLFHDIVNMSLRACLLYFNLSYKLSLYLTVWFVPVAVDTVKIVLLMMGV